MNKGSNNNSSNTTNNSTGSIESEPGIPTLKCKLQQVGNPTVMVYKEPNIMSGSVGALTANKNVNTIISVTDAGNGWYQIVSVEGDGTSDQNAGDEDDTDNNAEGDDSEESGSESDDSGNDDPDEEEGPDPIIGGYIQLKAVAKDGTVVPQLKFEKNAEGEVKKGVTKTKTDEDGNPIESEEGEEGSEEDTEGEEDEDEDDSAEPFYLDDNFYKRYRVNLNGATNNYAYNMDTDLSGDGILVSDIRGILGCPHQFLPSADVRIDSRTNKTRTLPLGSINSIGRVYSDKIIKNMPLLMMTAGTPSFMTQYSKKQKGLALKNLLGGVEDYELTSLLTGSNGRYYSLRFAYTEYFHYVNTMLRTAAVFFGVQDYEVDGTKLGAFNWLYYTTNPGEVTYEYSDDDLPDTEQRDMFGHAGLHTVLGSHAGAVAIYADCGNSTDDSFSNTTTQSQLSSALNSLSDTGREMNFLVGNVGSTLGLTLTKLTGMEDLQNNQSALTEIIDHALGGNNVLSNILNKCQTILAGGRMLFPEIWADSSFSRSYSCKMKLVSPAGDKLSIFLNILVPLYHMLAFVLPRQSIDQSYFSPFLVRAYSQGLFNVDMGIVTDLSVTKGTEGEWTIYGVPTVAEINFSIKDMYDGMFMSATQGPFDLTVFNNVSELDYIANSCGINLHDQEIARVVDLYKSLNIYGTVPDIIELDTIGGIQQWMNNRLDAIFGWH